MQAVLKIKHNYISLLKKYPQGQSSRLQHFDKWVASWNDPNISTYYQYFYNLQAQQHPPFIPECPKSKAALDTAQFNFRPGLAEFHRRFFPQTPEFADDSLPSIDTRDMTLKTFFRGFMKKQTRTDLQRLLLWGVIGVTSLLLYGWVWIINADDQQLVAQLEPDPSYYHYRIAFIRSYVEQCIAKIQFLEGHSRQVLEQARKRALERAASKKAT